ncbi:MAG: hypothetical protein HY832_00990 [Candidatus Aenigmarchaeota archaeon]|nr:hypothetical protein [Candidatus Aenigmarchaeota archaeon]
MKKPDWNVWLKNKAECKAWYDYYRKHGMLRKTTFEPETYLKKATHNLDFSNWVLGKHAKEIPETFGTQTFYGWVIVGYYYTVYHASLALIASKDIESKSHVATLSAIILFFYHEQKISKEDVLLVAESIGTTITKDDIEIIIDSKSLRERASYNVGYEFDTALVRRAQNNAVQFLRKARAVLEKR